MKPEWPDAILKPVRVANVEPGTWLCPLASLTAVLGLRGAWLVSKRRSTIKAPLMLIGIALIALGLVTFAYQGITYTTSKKVVSAQDHRAKREDDPAAPILGGLALAGGTALVVAATRKSVS